ncbi:MAG TPA: hypothetical protein VK121_00860 [Pseudogracilibacillus sp.]|nr:hypothetical protein [Pseudogracilibacillus sp.]
MNIIKKVLKEIVEVMLYFLVIIVSERRVIPVDLLNDYYKKQKILYSKNVDKLVVKILMELKSNKKIILIAIKFKEDFMLLSTLMSNLLYKKH